MNKPCVNYIYTQNKTSTVKRGWLWNKANLFRIPYVMRIFKKQIEKGLDKNPVIRKWESPFTFFHENGHLWIRQAAAWHETRTRIGECEPFDTFTVPSYIWHYLRNVDEVTFNGKEIQFFSIKCSAIKNPKMTEYKTVAIISEGALSVLAQTLGPLKTNVLVAVKDSDLIVKHGKIVFILKNSARLENEQFSGVYFPVVRFPQPKQDLHLIVFKNGFGTKDDDFVFLETTHKKWWKNTAPKLPISSEASFSLCAQATQKMYSNIKQVIKNNSLSPITLKIEANNLEVLARTGRDTFQLSAPVTKSARVQIELPEHLSLPLLFLGGKETFWSLSKKYLTITDGDSRQAIIALGTM